MDIERIKEKYGGIYTLEYLAETDSTNKYLKERRDLFESGHAVFAGTQSGGKGRNGRAFFCYDGGFYMSLLLKTGIPCENALDYTTAAAVAVCRAMEKNGSGEMQIKWVNDVYRSGKKVCGILTEAVTDLALGQVSIIIGIGVNLFAPKEFPDDIKDRAGFVFAEYDRALEENFALSLLNEAQALFSKAGDGCRDHTDEYIKRNIVAGKTVDIIRGGEKRRAFVRAIDETCALDVIYENGEKDTVLSGEVSIIV